MATDSSELTFIRCPSCRSLVPAISTRCRMCGASLNTAASATKDAPNADGRPSSRVRQRTVSMQSSPSEISNDFSPFTAPASENIEVRAPVDAPSTEVEEPTIDPRDPLGAFVEEVPLDTKEEKKAPPIDEVLAPDLDNQDLPDRFEPVHAMEPVKQNGFHAPSEKKSARPAPVKEPVKTEAVEHPEPVPAKEESVPVREKVHSESVLNAVTTKVHEAPKKPKAEEPASGKGKLVGWLVSYQNQMGQATELREGKFFVSRTSLKQNDLLLDDDSVSTPHALMKAVAAEGILVQDLMSDRGVFVRKKSSGGYQKSLEAVKLEHGDWVRFGDVEFLVCLVG